MKSTTPKAMEMLPNVSEHGEEGRVQAVTEFIHKFISQDESNLDDILDTLIMEEETKEEVQEPVHIYTQEKLKK